MRRRGTYLLGSPFVGLSASEVVEESPDLEPEDVAACLRFARRRVDHPVLAAYAPSAAWSSGWTRGSSEVLIELGDRAA